MQKAKEFTLELGKIDAGENPQRKIQKHISPV
jgi:hypothetical protein